MFFKKQRVCKKIFFFAVVDGFEPSGGDSISNISPAGWWSTPSYCLSIS